ncbi:MAG TPA: M48 family metallopeptidase [Solirubrobacterales bacterium]|nr:M48 family metallopeptidase [Solirubrobacterales bacterium]
MNFFEHQQRARRRTGRLVVLFALAVVLIIVAVELVALAAIGTGPGPGESWLEGETLDRNSALLAGIAVATLAAILITSLLRTITLRGGGGKVARQLGGTRVEPESADPLRRRLHNVVEEMAIASGVPVPEVYVLERERAINAFAAGYSTADAAVAVTQGALEQLDRDQLQGVVAHEFAHILNGDMRLNIRLIGLLFGILALAFAGRIALRAAFHGGGRSALAIGAIGLAVMLIGYVGLFFGRWIKASVSRQREYLADASAVQFTRNPDGLAGALKRIGAAQAGSRLEADADEVAHMLFARGLGGIFSTHPPLERRIEAIDPAFRPEELREIAAQMRLEADADRRRAEAAAEAEAAGGRRAGGGPWPLDPDAMIDRIGSPGVGEVLAAAALAAAIPRPLGDAAHSVEWAPDILCFLLLDPLAEIRERQLAMIGAARGRESEAQVRRLVELAPELPAEQRLPLLEIAFPALRARPEAELDDLLELIDELVRADGEVDAFEYALARLTAVQVADALDPQRAREAGRLRLAAAREEICDLLAIVARHGHGDEGAAREAFEAGAARALGERPPMPAGSADWPAQLDRSLASLDRLRPDDKRVLVGALVAAILVDGEAIPAEHELLRAVCASLHVPVPPLPAVGA